MAKGIVVPRGFRAAANTGLYWQGAKTLMTPLIYQTGPKTSAQDCIYRLALIVSAGHRRSLSFELGIRGHAVNLEIVAALTL
jgi:hypothetical protein